MPPTAVTSSTDTAPARPPPATAPSHSSSSSSSSTTGRVLVVSQRLPLRAAPHGWTTTPRLDECPALCAAVDSLTDTTPVWVGRLLTPQGTEDDITEQQPPPEVLYVGQRQYVPVPKESRGVAAYHDLFCRNVLWPLFHYVIGNNSAIDLVLESEAWGSYQRMNEAFANKIIHHYQPGDMVWIHDYHLLLVPKFVRQSIPNATIGLYLHLPFPSSEIFRCLPVRTQLLQGMLAANVIGFQTYAYARHFIMSCIASIDCEPTPSGIQMGSHFTAVGTFPVGIDFNFVNERRLHEDVHQWIHTLRQTYCGKKIILGHDKFDYIQGIPYKLIAFERFLKDNPEWRDRVVLLQVAWRSKRASDGSTPMEEAAELALASNSVGREKLESSVLEITDRINTTYGSEGHAPVHIITEDIDERQYYAMLTAADVCLITSIRDGVNLTTHDYIVCQQESMSPIILSEFAGTAGCFSSATMINPWNYQEVARAILNALTMSDDEKATKHKPLIDYIRKYTAAFWCASFLREMRTRARLEQGSVPNLDRRRLIDCYRSNHRRLFMLDYDGTLTPIVQTPAAARPSTELLETLNRLSKDPRNIVYIISGRDQAFLETMIGRMCPNVGLSAEHGTFFKNPPADAVWEDMSLGLDFNWKQDVMTTFQAYTDRTPGSFIEQKRSSITWHYRLSEPQYGAHMAQRCAIELESYLADNFVAAEVLTGKKNVEVRPKSITKGQVIQRLLRMFHTTGFIFCAGDDRTDEDMFKSLVNVPGNVFTCLVGPARKTCATCRVEGPQQLIEILAALGDTDASLTASF